MKVIGRHGAKLMTPVIQGIDVRNAFNCLQAVKELSKDGALKVIVNSSVDVAAIGGKVLKETEVTNVMDSVRLIVEEESRTERPQEVAR